MLMIGSNINEARVDGSLKALQRDLNAFAGFGLNAAEISIHGLDGVRNGQLNRQRAAEAAAILADYPFRYSAHAPNPINLMDQEHQSLHRQVLFASLEFAQLIGAGCMVYHPGRYQVEESFGLCRPVELTNGQRDDLLAQEVEVLREAADTFPDMTIAMENARPYLHHSPYCYAEKPAELVRQIQTIDRDNVRLTLDFGHLHLSAGFYGLDEVAEVRRMAPWIAHCHVHDNFGRSIYHWEKNQAHQIPFGKGDSHMPVGWGNIPFAGLFGAFIDGYEGLLICELRSRYFEHTAEAAVNLQRVLTEEGGGLALAVQR